MQNKNMSSDIYQGLIWILLAVIGYGITFAFNEEITNYRYGAAAWPRVLLISLAVLGLFQIFKALKVRRLHLSSSLKCSKKNNDEKPFPLLYFSIIVAYAYFLSRAGFYITTPIFIFAFLHSMGVVGVAKKTLISLFIYALILLAFVRLLYLPLPTGSWAFFYEANNWLLTIIRS